MFMHDIKIFLFIYLTVINAAGFLFMHSDKRRARKNCWRVPERTLMTLAAAGGSAGVLAGMYVFHHKTRHRKFTIGVPLLLAIQLLCLIALLFTVLR